MRIVSMVPSWTETLIESGADVVGRTRFCIHPRDRVKSIPVVGGTKDIDWEKLREIQPELLFLDREENPKEMAERSASEVFVTHVTRVSDVSSELDRFARRMNEAGSGSAAVATRLHGLAERWRRVQAHPVSHPISDLLDFPGLQDWLRKPDEHIQGAHRSKRQNARLIYVIWRNPWMSVSRETFIGSVFEKLGWPMDRFGPEGPKMTGRYPEFSLEDQPRDSIVLFSSEPFPFHKKKSELIHFPFIMGIVDGEVYSWFGVRSLRFMERALGIDVSREEIG